MQALDKFTSSALRGAGQLTVVDVVGGVCALGCVDSQICSPAQAISCHIGSESMSHELPQHKASSQRWAANSNICKQLRSCCWGILSALELLEAPAAEGITW